MTIRRLGILQWLGLMAGFVMLAAGHTLGLGLTIAECNAGGRRWGIVNDPWQGALLGVTALVAVLAGAASVSVILATRGTSYEDDPPLARMRFLAIAAVAAELFLALVLLLDLAGNVFNHPCRGA